MEKNDIITFFAFSADKKPGQGVGEFVADPKLYIELEHIPHWRRVFSSLWDNEAFEHICLDGAKRRFKSVCHALNAEKFLFAGYKDIAVSFSLDSNSELGKASGLTAHKARKIVKIKEEIITEWWEIEKEIKRKIYLSRYSKGLARKVMLATGNAELWNRGPRITTIRCTSLEAIREEIRNCM
jgi:hypothetical protein